MSTSAQHRHRHRPLRALAAGLALASTAWVPMAAATAPAPATPQLALNTPTVQDLSPLDVHPRTTLTIVEQLKRNHYVKQELDDATSSQVFDKYLDLLDGGRAYLLAADVAGFEQYRYQLDEALKRGNLSPAFQVFNVYQQRVAQRLEALIADLEDGIDDIDFTLDEYLDLEREQLPWEADQAGLDALWRKRLKATVLNMRLNGKDNAEIQELLLKRYKNRLYRTGQTNSEDAFQLFVNAYASTYDPHTQYFSPRISENFNINMSLSLEGIGAVLGNRDEYTSVVRLVPAGPADKAGQLRPNHRILAVGQGADGAMVDVVGWRLDDVVELIRGPKGSIVRLDIQKDADDAEMESILITRNEVKLEEQSAQSRVMEIEHNGQPRTIGVIEVPTFYVDFRAMQQGEPDYRSTTRDVRRLIGELKDQGVDGIVVDLRNNGGGSLQEASSLTGLFIPRGPTVQIRGANNTVHIDSDKDQGAVAWDGPLAVLVNRLSASASEIFAGAMQDYGRGPIIGSQTFGKGTVQTLIPLNRGQLKMTQAKFYRISGQSTQHQGILPDINFPEVYDTDSIGESSLDDALPWDVIKPATYRKRDTLGGVLGAIRTRHEERVAGDPEFSYLRALASRAVADRQKTRLSLNEAQRKAEKAAEDAWRLEQENLLRVARGEEPVASLKELEELDSEADEVANNAAGAADNLTAVADSADDNPLAADDDAPAASDDTATAQAPADRPDEPDALLTESGHILLDYVGLTTQVAAASDPDVPLTLAN